MQISSERQRVPTWLISCSVLLGTGLGPQGETRVVAHQLARPSPYLVNRCRVRYRSGLRRASSVPEAIELNGVFTPDLKEFFFARLIEGVQTMHHSVLTDGVWSAPRPLLLFAGRTRAVADDMAVSPDGRELYFLGVHSHPHADAARSPDIWRSTRNNGQWSTAEVLPPPISTDAAEVYPVVVGDGSLYFTSNRSGGLGPNDLYRAQRLTDGRFGEPALVPRPSTASTESEMSTCRVTRLTWSCHLGVRQAAEVGTSSCRSGSATAIGMSPYRSGTPSTQIRRSSVPWSRPMASIYFSVGSEAGRGARLKMAMCSGSI